MLQVFIYGYNKIDNCFSIAVQQYVMLHIPFSTIYGADFAKHLIQSIETSTRAFVPVSRCELIFMAPRRSIFQRKNASGHSLMKIMLK
jgi:hypothetical protein